jgi:hypothetical protein
VADFDNPDSEHIVVNGVNDAIISLSDPITILTEKLFTLTLKPQEDSGPVSGFCWFLISHFSG